MPKQRIWKLLCYGTIIAIVSMFTGALISYSFDYDPESVFFIIKSLVWALNILIPYCIIISIIKIFDKTINFIELWLLFFSYLISVALILFIGGFDAVYVSTFVTVAGIFGMPLAIYNVATKKKIRKKNMQPFKSLKEFKDWQ